MIVAWRCPVHGTSCSSTGESSLAFECGCVYGKRSGVVDFVGHESYAKAFGLQWDRWSATQLDSYTNTSISRDRLRQSLGEDLFQRLETLRVLEVGCGAGRFTEVMLDQGAQVLSLDISTAAYINATNFPPSHRHEVARADAVAPPLQEQQFDLVLALGVVQHTPRSDLTVRSLWSLVAPNGTLVFDHYPFGFRHIFRLKPLYRQWLKRQSPDVAIHRANELYDRWAPRHHRVTTRVARFALTRISPIVCFTSEYPQLARTHREEWGRLDTFDSLTDWYKHRSTRRRLSRLVVDLRPGSYVVTPGGTGWLVRASRGPISSC